MTDLFPETATDWAREREQVLAVFTDMLRGPTGDGSAKRQAGTKVAWWRDQDHEAAMYSHLSKWLRGELRDEHSGSHPLVHLAWRALALAYMETRGEVPPPEHCKD